MRSSDQGRVAPLVLVVLLALVVLGVIGGLAVATENGAPDSPKTETNIESVDAFDASTDDAYVETAPADATGDFTGDSSDDFTGDFSSEESVRDTSPSTGSQRRSSTSDDILMENELRAVDPAGTYGATTRFEVPDRVTRLNVTLPPKAHSVETTGFSTTDGTTYSWDGSTEQPTLTYRMDANETSEPGLLAGDGDYIFVDRQDWGLVRVPNIGVGWGWRGTTVRLHRSNTIDGAGAVGDVIAFLGPHREYVREAHGQRFRLIVPADADLEESPEAILDTYAYSADRLRVGSRDSAVFTVAAPTGDVAWAVRGLQTGPADIWVRDVERLDDPQNVWIHEYVHSRHGYLTAESAQWFTEASATYYAALLTLDRGAISYDEFRQLLARGTESPQSDSVLADPGTWRNNADYTKGGLVAGDIDRRIRVETDGAATLSTVFRELNARDDPVDSAAFLRAVDDAGGSSVATDAERFTRTSDAPSTWDQSAHDAAFGQLPALIGYSIAADDAVRASGPYRNRSLAREPVILVPDETLEVGVEIENSGETAGEYELTFVLDGRVVDTREGRIDAHTSTVERFEREFTDPGDHEVNVGGERLSVVVEEPATPIVTELDVSPTEITAGETVTVTATVHNDGGHPARDTFHVEIAGNSQDPQTVRLDIDDTVELEWSIQPEHTGITDIRVGEQTRQVTITAADPQTALTETPPNTGDSNRTPAETSTRTPGFGLGIALLALFVTIASRMAFLRE